VAVAAALWAGATTWYIVCRDEFAQTFLARQAEMRFAYEDRVTELKNRLEREVTSGLVERKGFGARVEALAKRQTEIEARQIWLAGLAERVSAGGSTLRAAPAELQAPGLADLPVPIFPAPPRPEASPAAASKPTPVPVEPFDLRLRSRGDDSAAMRVPERLSAIETSLRRASDAAIAAADAVRRGARDRAFLVRQALSGTRVPLPAPPVRDKDTGGPFIPAPKALDAAAFAPLAADAEEAAAELEHVTAAASALPLRKPLAGDLEPTSGFGYRLDPFNRAAAVHSGVDFRAAPGAPVRATAAGRVTVAEYSGGYGNMVEVEHEGGVATRYGHLSSISVVQGQRIEAGQVVGRAGSTGRSTGTHLHYETRIDGEAVNPARFLEAGRLLAATQ
jgi:murein DD-endopeptidase MepM/ murein hydrolase activator NlpD